MKTSQNFEMMVLIKSEKKEVECVFKLLTHEVKAETYLSLTIAVSCLFLKKNKKKKPSILV